MTNDPVREADSYFRLIDKFATERWRCMKCGCLWRLNQPRSWSLFDSNQEPCSICDNSPEFMNVIVPAETGDESIIALWRALTNEAAALSARDQRIAGYQASRDWAIERLAKALGIEPDKLQAVEYYAEQSAQRIAALEDQLRVAVARIGELTSIATEDAEINERLDRRVEAAEGDAGRYRWLREHWFDVGGPMEGSARSNIARAADVESVDAAIDAAIAAQNAKP